MTLVVGSVAPDFTLPTDGGGSVTLSKFRGKLVVVYFYPKDDTSGCTKQACAFRDALEEFAAVGALVIGISRDSVAAHDRFKAKYGLTFPLACDESGEVCQAWGTWVEKSMYGRKYMGIDRATFLVDRNGALCAIWRKVKVPGHVEAVLKEIQKVYG